MALTRFFPRLQRLGPFVFQQRWVDIAQCPVRVYVGAWKQRGLEVRPEIGGMQKQLVDKTVFGATYDFRARKNGLGADTHTVVVSGDTTRDFVLPELFQEDVESGDFVVWPWVQSGNAPWTIDAASPYEGSYSAKSGSISHNQASTMTLTLELAEAGNVSFW